MEIAERRIQTICLLTLTFIAVGGALYLMRSVLVPLVLAGFFAILLSPALEFFHRRLKAPRGLALVLTLLLGIGLLVLLGTLITGSVAQMADQSDAYKANAVKLLDWVAGVLPLDRLKLDEGAAIAKAKELLESAAPEVLGVLKSLLGDGVLVLLFLVFIVLGDPRPNTGAAGEIEASIKQYLTTKVFVSGLTGVLVGVMLYVMGVPMALVWGVLSFLLNFIPNVGSMIAVLLPVPVILTAPDLTPTVRALAIALPAVTQFAIGNILEPKLMGSSVELNPVVILAALVFWSILWGPVGALLAVPLTAMLRILLEKVDVTRPIANVLAGRHRSE